MALLSPIPRASAWRRILRGWLAVCGAFALLGAPVRAAPAGDPSDEYKLKAVFLFNFAQFVEWPPKAFASPHAPIVIGLLGNDPFGRYLDELVAGETIDGRAIVVRRYGQPRDARDCHILFVNRSDLTQLKRTLHALEGAHTLTVGDAASFNAAGGMVRFVTEAGKIRLRINLQAAKAAGLQISSKILRPATIVGPGGD